MKIPGYRPSATSLHSGGLAKSRLISAKLALGILIIILWILPVKVNAQRRAIDVNKSTLTIRVFKSGMFSAFAHDHEIKAPIAEGAIDSSSNPTVQLRLDARKLRVMDPDIAKDKRAEIQHTMEGTEVLDVEHFPQISFQSTRIAKLADGKWEVNGNLSLHGKTEPVSVLVSNEQGHYLGHAALKQSKFGIQPISVAGGTIKVKDEIKIEFEIVPSNE
ncbi:MAG: hypothetical protein QOD84_1454 [Acidobacteriaceae bacterium]